MNAPLPPSLGVDFRANLAYLFMKGAPSRLARHAWTSARQRIVAQGGSTLEMMVTRTVPKAIDSCACVFYAYLGQ